MDPPWSSPSTRPALGGLNWAAQHRLSTRTSAMGKSTFHVGSPMNWTLTVRAGEPRDESRPCTLPRATAGCRAAQEVRQGIRVNRDRGSTFARELVARLNREAAALREREIVAPLLPGGRIRTRLGGLNLRVSVPRGVRRLGAVPAARRAGGGAGRRGAAVGAWGVPVTLPCLARRLALARPRPATAGHVVGATVQRERRAPALPAGRRRSAAGVPRRSGGRRRRVRARPGSD